MSRILETLGITIGELAGAGIVIGALVAGIAAFRTFGDAFIALFM